MKRSEVQGHLPVMVGEVIGVLADVSFLVDGTVGGGGHAERFLESAAPGARLLGIDRDPEMVERARARLARFGDRVQIAHGSYADLERILDEHELGDPDGVLLDLGASSFHFDDPDRGFSFASPGPLDMRYDRSGGETAADLVNRLPERELADLLFELGDERSARRIARAIVGARPIRDTLRLAEVVRGAAGGRGRIHAATRTFQSLRIATNRELEHLEQGLTAAISRIAPGGRVVVLSFHSGEDRIAKRVMKKAERAGRGRLLFSRPVRPTEEEVRANPRARSARLRACERVEGKGA
jgi:16S rRNA (cytosine1402-N4)-methyltransferase